VTQAGRGGHLTYAASHRRYRGLDLAVIEELLRRDSRVGIGRTILGELKPNLIHNPRGCDSASAADNVSAPRNPASQVAQLLSRTTYCRSSAEVRHCTCRWRWAIQLPESGWQRYRGYRIRGSQTSIAAHQRALPSQRQHRRGLRMLVCSEERGNWSSQRHASASHLESSEVESRRLPEVCWPPDVSWVHHDQIQSSFCRQLPRRTLRCNL
jgi:hypothetical protein